MCFPDEGTDPGISSHLTLFCEREIAFDTFVNFSKNNVRILILFIHYTVCCPSGLAFTDLARLNDSYAVIGG